MVKEKLSNFIKKVLIRISPLMFARLMYRKVFGEKPDLRDPKNFNEKLTWLKLFGVTPLMVQCSDKYRMREYVEEKGLGRVLPKLIGTYENSAEIPWDGLPDRFALKCNHGCRYNIICADKKKFDISDASKRLDRWLKEDFSLYANEPHYRGIRPLIICEEFLDDGAGLPNDYKIYCFNGTPTIVLGCYGRGTDLKYEFYDTAWNVMDICTDKNERRIRKPDSLDEMLEYSKTLAEPFPFVRVDWYDIHAKPVLGELTLIPSAGLWDRYTREGLDYMGRLITLPEHAHSRRRHG